MLQRSFRIGLVCRIFPAAALLLDLGSTAEAGSPPTLAVYEGAAYDGVKAIGEKFIPRFGRAPDMGIEFVDFSN